MQENESITNLSHRINLLAHRLFPDEANSTTLNRIKFLKFREILRKNIQTIIKLENISDYQQAVDKANLAQTCFAEENSVSTTIGENFAIQTNSSQQSTRESRNNSSHSQTHYKKQNFNQRRPSYKTQDRNYRKVTCNN